MPKNVSAPNSKNSQIEAIISVNDIINKKLNPLFFSLYIPNQFNTTSAKIDVKTPDKKDSRKVLLQEFGVIEKEHNFFDDLEDFKIKISNLFKNKLSNYKDDSLEDIYNKLDDFEGRLIWRN